MKKIAIFLLFSLMIVSPVRAAIDFLDHKQAKLGEAVPDFQLKDVSGTVYRLSDYKGKVVMIHFWSATCPFVVRYDGSLKKIAEDYGKQGVVVLGIDSNKGENPNQIKKVTGKRKLNYPVLLDQENKVADQFGAIATPHVFIINQEGKLVYEGAIDDQGWSEETTPRKFYVREALDQTLKGEKVTTPQTKSVGCTVKRA